jgi:hypothetical protein
MLEDYTGETVAYCNRSTNEIIYAKALRKGNDLDEVNVKNILQHKFTNEEIMDIISFIRRHEQLHKENPGFSEKEVLLIQAQEDSIIVLLSKPLKIISDVPQLKRIREWLENLKKKYSLRMKVSVFKVNNENKQKEEKKENINKVVQPEELNNG